MGGQRIYCFSSASLLVAAFVGLTTEALPLGGDSNNHRAAAAGSADPQYSLNRHFRYDRTEGRLTEVGETESLTFYSSTNDERARDEGQGQRQGPSFVCQNLSTSHAAAGAEANPSSNAAPTAIFSVARFETSQDPWSARKQRGADASLEDEESDDEDEGDDEDDDGANLMLSSASVKQRGPAFVVPADTVSPSARTSSVLLVRGGAAATASANEFSKRLLVAALVTLLYEGCLGHLLEFLKIVMQTSPPGTSYASVLKRITADKGIAGIWDGFLPWGVVQAVFKGGVFGLAHAAALSSLMPLAENGKMPKQLALTLAGGIAGGFQGFVLSPTLLLKTRVMTNDIFREQMSVLRTTLLSLSIGLDVVRDEGLFALMKGSQVFAFKRVCDWSSRYYFSDVFSRMLLAYAKTPSLTPAEKIAADLLGGTASTIVTLPLDVIVAKIQDAKKAGAKVSAWDLFREEVDKNGFEGLAHSYLQGFEARLLHVCFTTVAMKTGTGIMYEALFGKK